MKSPPCRPSSGAMAEFHLVGRPGTAGPGTVPEAQREESRGIGRTRDHQKDVERWGWIDRRRSRGCPWPAAAGGTPAALHRRPKRPCRGDGGVLEPLGRGNDKTESPSHTERYVRRSTHSTPNARSSVSPFVGDHTQFLQKMTVAFAGGSGPDVFTVGTPGIPLFGKQGSLRRSRNTRRSRRARPTTSARCRSLASTRAPCTA